MQVTPRKQYNLLKYCSATKADISIMHPALLTDFHQANKKQE
jgi:hypothetical protein